MSVYIQEILGSECIGDSLPKINLNFSQLGDATNTLINTAANVGITATGLTGNGTSRSFEINGYVDDVPEKYLVFVNGLHRHPGTDYTIADNHVVFPSPPANGASISVLSLRLG